MGPLQVDTPTIFSQPFTIEMDLSRSNTRASSPPSPFMNPRRPAPKPPGPKLRPGQPPEPPPSRDQSHVFHPHHPPPPVPDQLSPQARKDSQITNRALYDVIIGLPCDVQRGIITLLESARPSEIPLAKERIVACRRAWDEWNAFLAGFESGGGAAAFVGGGLENWQAAGAEEMVRKERYMLAKARIMHFDAFETRAGRREEGRDV
jgi:hypothetical protein